MRTRCRPLVTLAVVLSTYNLAAADEAAAPTPTAAPKAASSDPKPLADPTILLVRDDAVRKELKLNAEKLTALDSLLHTHNRMLLAIRDVSPAGADETAQPALAEIKAELKSLFDAKQRARMQNLVLRAQGYDALARKDVAAQLKLTPEQLASLAAIGGDIRTEIQELQKSAPTRTPVEQARQLAALNADRHSRTLEVLNQEQQQLWVRLLGPQFDFAKVTPSPAWAPEFDGIDAWLNSDPLTMESLRGQVVVVHFFAFGCINCIHNYPWYREWQQDLAGKGVTIVGIHTPETQTETDNELLRASLEENDLKFPVAVDKEKKMWQAWYNGIWPSVYLIDKQGRVRFWWYGELDWEGAGQQKVARQKIEALLAESHSGQHAPLPTSLSGEK